ncbi:ATP-dependent helicase HrpA, partial [gut metagenome]
PALVDRGRDCAIEVFDDPQEAAREHRKGLLRLFRLTLREQVRFVERSVRDLGRVQMQAQMVPGLAALFESAESLATEVADCALMATALADPRPTDEASFRERREDVKGRLTLVAGEISRLLIEIVTQSASIPSKLKKLSDEKALVSDIETQLRTLFTVHFLTTVPLSQLTHYPRYLKAIQYRLDRYRDDPARDAQRQREIERLTVPLNRAIADRRGQPDARLD